jgi:hypothetical protein
MPDMPPVGVPPAPEIPSSGGMTTRQRGFVAGGIVLVILVLVAAIVAVVAMLRNPGQTANFRDIVIILVAAEAMFIGLAMIILIVQLAKLTALLQNEVKPILESTSETLNTLRGTTAFLSNNLVQPVIKANSSVAAARRALDLLRMGRSK